eukprot:CAMPEP_0196823056 /NCGR_PEP_ID=MMETSP1362-20130617/85955_1 /TAXON_ID=163516 /ORGANISM="Leptocylindrus danicus, Strain CCMP1856" /LENGTH=430 /DNA_ID=CAMNT_0042202795 /DNA_START=313 /DNA_END=1605 /DNA_ORIENTATION=+
MEEHRETVLTLALANVHQHGWTQEAIVSAVQAANLPLTLSGVILNSSTLNNDNTADATATTSSSDPGAALVYTFMDRSNAQLRQILFDSSILNANPPLSGEENPNKANLASDKVKERLYFALKTRLEMLTPYIRSKRWHEAMAIGALPQNALNTTRRLNDLVDCIEQDLNFVTPGMNNNSMLSKAAIGGVYVACELHMLGESHDHNVAEFDATWSFLKQRIEELDALANVNDVNATSMLAVSTVAASMGSAVLSLGQPLARGAISAMAGTILPQLMMMGQQAASNNVSNNSTVVPKGGRPSDYEPRSTSNGGSVRNFSTSDDTTDAKRLVDSAIESSSSDNDVVIFSKTYCPYCSATKHLFAQQMPDVKVQVIELDEETNGDVMQAYLMERSGQRTVPNVFVKGKHLGGNDATQSAYKSGMLMELLTKGS